MLIRPGCHARFVSTSPVLISLSRSVVPARRGDPNPDRLVPMVFGTVSSYNALAFSKLSISTEFRSARVIGNM